MCRPCLLLVTSQAPNGTGVSHVILSHVYVKLQNLAVRVGSVLFHVEEC